jgi:regulator of protease activity HflC (stomatin/prohibitin superfamily)
MEMLNTLAGLAWAVALLYVAVKFMQAVRMVPTQSAYIVERLGRYHGTLNPGFHFLIPFFDRVAYVQDLKEAAMEVPPQDCFTKDNVKVEVDGILYLSVVNPVAASYGITNYREAAIQLVQTTTRSAIGTIDLDRTFEERDLINSRVLQALGEVSAAWGIQVHRYEVKGIVPPASVRDAMERQMNAERERRAALAKAEGEKLTRINESEGLKQELINRSEGEMRRRVNEAEGKAAEILAIARATAESIEKMGRTLVSEGGAEAVRMRLAQGYLGRLSLLARKNTDVVLSADLTDMGSMLAAIDRSLVTPEEAAAPAPRASPLAPPARAAPPAAHAAGLPPLDAAALLQETARRAPASPASPAAPAASSAAPQGAPPAAPGLPRRPREE